MPGAGVPVDTYAALNLPREGSSPSAYALFVGDLNANKDPMCAVAAVEECRRRGRPLELTVIGEGHLADDIRTATRTRPWLHLVDRTRAIPSWMAHAQVLLAPSYREGVPRVIIEALAAGTPVVARRNRGSVELLAGGLGEILPTDDPQAWADAVEHVLDAPADTVAMRERAEAYGLDRFRSAYSDLVTQMESKRSLL
nr:glycosyltransferase [Ornithinimicrobium cryptoxanthini]